MSVLKPILVTGTHCSESDGLAIDKNLNGLYY